ncbi:MAG: hypothetical protein RLZZ429_600, partial [Bacteroidota bacterium]
LMDSENTLPTYHEKIMIAKVRNLEMESMHQEFNMLIHLAKQRKGTMEMVAKMKQLVPEFVSNNSVFEQLDQQGNADVITMKVG